MSIEIGDLVIVYSNRDQIDALTVTAGKTLQSRFGSFKHDLMVGVPWGTKFSSSNGRGFVYLLKPTPELWTLALPHRTQILYLPDIAFITSFLDIKAGSKVIEAGTGSGSFSHSLVRTVGKTGKVYSFEFHEDRFNKAKEEFSAHGLDEIIQIKHQNVYRDGFEVVDLVDSVFLDVPAPWEALAHAKTALRKDLQSRICCFSPCIEQVIRTVSSLTDLGFSDITITNQRPSFPPRIFTSKPTNTHLRGHTSFLTFATLRPSPSPSSSLPTTSTTDKPEEPTTTTGGGLADETDEFPLSPGAREALLAVDESVLH
ncbi:hypothetical protein RQP46_001624 [Phenoliferia psychrophenolica]